MLCRCISRMTSFVPFMRGGLRFMALPCCLVHCEVRQTQSSLHHSTRHSSTIAFQFHPSSQYTLPPPHNLLYLPSFVSARPCPCMIGGKSLCAYSFLLLIKIYDQPFLLYSVIAGMRSRFLGTCTHRFLLRGCRYFTSKFIFFLCGSHDFSYESPHCR